MFCNSCGTHIQAGQSVCPSCGKAVWVPVGGAPITAAGVAPVQSRVAQHVGTLGVLWIVYGALTALGGGFMLLALNLFSAGVMGNETPMPPFIRPMLGFIGMMFLITGLVRILAGWAVYSKQSWGRILCLILGFLSLIDVPLGTALGIYTIWVLLSPGADQQYHQLAYAQ